LSLADHHRVYGHGCGRAVSVPVAVVMSIVIVMLVCLCGYAMTVPMRVAVIVAFICGLDYVVEIVIVI
jgi:hypothetical protein